MMITRACVSVCFSFLDWVSSFYFCYSWVSSSLLSSSWIKFFCTGYIRVFALVTPSSSELKKCIRDPIIETCRSIGEAIGPRLFERYRNHSVLDSCYIWRSLDWESLSSIRRRKAIGYVSIEIFVLKEKRITKTAAQQQNVPQQSFVFFNHESIKALANCNSVLICSSLLLLRYFSFSMACSKAEDLINQLIEATLKLLDFGLNIMDALRVQKLLTIRNQKIGLISDDACLPECSLRFSLNFDLMMFNKLLRNACLRARATLNELRVCRWVVHVRSTWSSIRSQRLRYPNAPLVLEPKTKLKFHKLQKKIQDFDEAVRSDKMIARRDLRDFREISIIFSQLEHDLKLLICSLECASTMKDTVLFAAPITDVMTVLSIVLNRLVNEQPEQQSADMYLSPLFTGTSSTKGRNRRENCRRRTTEGIARTKTTGHCPVEFRHSTSTAAVDTASDEYPYRWSSTVAGEKYQSNVATTSTRYDSDDCCC